MSRWQRSQELYATAQQLLPGGVSSNVRLLAKPFPLYFDHAEGAMIYDVDGNAYIDYVLGQGPLILGHSHPAILEAVTAALHRGQLYAGQHELEITVAQQLVEPDPMRRFVPLWSERFGNGSGGHAFGACGHRTIQDCAL